MTAKEYLSRYVNCERRIESKLEKITELKDKAISISVNFGEKVQTSKQANGREKIISMYMDMQNDIQNEIKKLRAILKNISDVISSLDNEDQKEILERRYINNQGFPDIAEEMHISLRQIFRIHGKALEKIQFILENT